MTKVYYGLRAAKESGLFFEENSRFSKQSPYIVRVKDIATGEITPLHCAKTFELSVCENLKGTMKIANQIYELSGVQAFIVPPNVVHSSTVYSCEGKQYVMQVSLPHMKEYLNVEALLEYDGMQMSLLDYICPEGERIAELIKKIVEYDNEFGRAVSCIAEMFSIFGQYRRNDEENASADEEKHITSNKNGVLQKLLDYTMMNYSRDITIEEAATLCGYSKSYFCKWFKAMTGMTYFTHLNDVRNMHASLLLKSGKSVTECCSLCGFSNLSYFTQQFKKKQNMTPREYALHYSAAKDSTEDVRS